MVISRDLSFLRGISSDDFSFHRKKNEEKEVPFEKVITQDKEVRENSQSSAITGVIVVVVPEMPVFREKQSRKPNLRVEKSTQKESHTINDQDFGKGFIRTPGTTQADLQKFQFQGMESAVSALKKMQDILSPAPNKVDKVT